VVEITRIVMVTQTFTPIPLYTPASTPSSTFTPSITPNAAQTDEAFLIDKLREDKGIMGILTGGCYEIPITNTD
jgi:hypothetical protein